MTLILRHATLATMNGGYGLIEDGAVVIEGEHIAWIGAMAELPSCRGEIWDCEGRLITPGLIDCHTHLVFAGNRAAEFELRLRGVSYEEIARRGGGILSTVSATRAATEQALLASALQRLEVMCAQGVTVVEVKSGYGLDIETELKQLRVARQLAQHRPVRIFTSFLGAHALPPDYGGRHEAYLREVALPALRAAHAQGLVDAVDGFCERIAFSPHHLVCLFAEAQALGLPVKLHAEQLSAYGGAALAARFRALSADHLEYLDEEGIQAMAAAGTVAVLLPGAFYTLRETRLPPVELLRRYGVPLAVATDCNPGSSPLTSLLLAMNMACTLFGLTPEEALAGATCNAARALGLSDCGRIAVNCRADLAIWDVRAPAELIYWIGFAPLHARFFGGRCDG